MKFPLTAIVLSLALSAGSALAQGPTCKVQASDKKLAGAALKSFMTKCRNDATAACDKAAMDKKLAGAAKTSFVRKCMTDMVGN
jgi:hypothetical protein